MQGIFVCDHAGLAINKLHMETIAICELGSTKFTAQNDHY